MITAEDAKRLSEEGKKNILASDRFKHIFETLETWIKNVAERGGRHLKWDGYTHSDMRLLPAEEDIFVRKMKELGYNVIFSDKFHYTIEW